jgi:hypothetical protein
VTLVTPEGTVAQPFQTWANRANIPAFDDVVRLDYDMARCDGGESGGVLGCATKDRITVGGPHCSMAPKFRATCRFIFLHELGHVFNYSVLPWGEQEAFKQISLWPSSADWIATSNLTGVTPAEDFADGFAMCAMKKRMMSFATRSWADNPTYWQPGPRQFAAACALIAATPPKPAPAAPPEPTPYVPCDPTVDNCLVTGATGSVGQ